jgi:hypothetical protein
MSVPSVETSIWRALKGRVETLPISIVPQSSIAWPKISFTKPQANNKPAAYIEVRHLPNKADRILIRGDRPHRRPGILQLDYMEPVASTLNDVHVAEKAGQIAAHFPPDLKMAFHTFLSTAIAWSDQLVWNDAVTWDGSMLGVIVARVERAPDVSQGFADGAYWRVPISIRYDCFA